MDTIFYIGIGIAILIALACVGLAAALKCGKCRPKRPARKACAAARDLRLLR